MAAVIVVTAFGSLPTAAQAVEGGAFDYLAKPFDLSQALRAVEKALNTPAARASRAASIPICEEAEKPGDCVS